MTRNRGYNRSHGHGCLFAGWSFAIPPPVVSSYFPSLFRCYERWRARDERAKWLESGQRQRRARSKHGTEHWHAGERRADAFERRSFEFAAEHAGLQQIAVAGRGNDDGHEWSGEFYATIRGERATRVGDGICDGWRGYDRSG